MHNIHRKSFRIITILIEINLTLVHLVEDILVYYYYTLFQYKDKKKGISGKNIDLEGTEEPIFNFISQKDTLN